jgi:hypothetical protein
LEESQGFILSVVRAAELPECDFGIEYSLGRDMDVSHLEKLRATARIVVSDTRRLQAAGKIDDAVRRVVALYSMSMLVRHDHLSQSSSASLGFARMASDEVRRLCGANVLAAGQREAIKRAADPLSGKDPFAFADAILREGSITYHYLSTRFRGDTAGGEFLRTVAVGGEPEAAVAAISAMNEAAFVAEAARARDYYTRVSEAWTRDDATDRLHALEEKVVKNEFGPVALLVCPGMSSALANTTQQLALVREARGLLDAPGGASTPDPIHGPVPPQNPPK